jgi:DNA-binding SARP family transcriptional activator
MTARYCACMFFGVLGPVAVWTADGEPVPVPGLKVRALLAVLLVHEGRPVPAARLIDALWGERLPGDPAGTLSGKVTQLRRSLERAEPGGRRLVASPPPGYRLRLDANAVDVDRFRALAAQTRGRAPGCSPARWRCGGARPSRTSPTNRSPAPPPPG